MAGLPKPQTVIERAPGGWNATVRADTVVRRVVVFAESLEKLLGDVESLWPGAALVLLDDDVGWSPDEPTEH